jgi:hypothetical protein
LTGSRDSISTLRSSVRLAAGLFLFFFLDLFAISRATCSQVMLESRDWCGGASRVLPPTRTGDRQGKPAAGGRLVLLLFEEESAAARTRAYGDGPPARSDSIVGKGRGVSVRLTD